MKRHTQYQSQSGNHVPPVIDIDVDVVRPGSPAEMPPEDLADLRRAQRLLSTPGVAVRFANVLGAPIEKGLRLLPGPAAKMIHFATRAALNSALGVALRSMEPGGSIEAANRRHKMLAGASGAVGGALGLGSVLFELPVSTTLILRSIAQIASSQGHDLRSLDVRLACLEVFALGGDTTGDNAAETSYWAVRTALARLVSEAAGTLAGRAVSLGSAPTAVRLISALAARFGVIVSEQVAAKAVPIAGAAAGAAINVVFMDHFQKMAEGHFIVRRLERRHGTDMVRSAYESFAQLETA